MCSVSIVVYTVPIVSKQLHRDKPENSRSDYGNSAMETLQDSSVIIQIESVQFRSITAFRSISN